jgi:hypothetical protein
MYSECALYSNVHHLLVSVSSDPTPTIVPGHSPDCPFTFHPYPFSSDLYPSSFLSCLRDHVPAIAISHELAAIIILFPVLVFSYVAAFALY